MATTLQSIAIGPGERLHSWRRVVGLVGGLFLATLAAYASGLFSVSGGLVWIPVDAALVGMLASCAVGYDRSGLVVAWATTFSAVLGWHADHALFGLSRRPIGQNLAYFLRPDGLAVLAIQGILLGTIAFGVGVLLRRGVDARGLPAFYQP